MDLKLPSDPRGKHCLFTTSIAAFKQTNKQGCIKTQSHCCSPVAPHLEVAKTTDPDKITEREKAHVKAFLAYGSGDLPQATEDWATLLVDYPHGRWAVCVLYVGAFPFS